MGITERREREKEEIRHKILDAARELFAAEGYEKVTMRRIAEAIEYSPTTIYLHFEDKDDLVRALCHADFGSLLEAMRLAPVSSDPVEAIRQLGRAYCAFALQHPNQYRFMFMTPVGKEEKLEERQPRRSPFAHLLDAVKRAAAAGRFRAIDPSPRHRCCGWAFTASPPRSSPCPTALAARPRRERPRRSGDRQRAARPAAADAPRPEAMVSLARKNLSHDRLRFVITVAGVAFAVTLVLVQVGLFLGLLDKATVTIRTCERRPMGHLAQHAERGLRAHLPRDGGPARPQRARRRARRQPDRGVHEHPAARAGPRRARSSTRSRTSGAGTCLGASRAPRTT